MNLKGEPTTATLLNLHSQYLSLYLEITVVHKDKYGPCHTAMKLLFETDGDHYGKLQTIITQSCRIQYQLKFTTQPLKLRLRNNCGMGGVERL